MICRCYPNSDFRLPNRVISVLGLGFLWFCLLPGLLSAQDSESTEKKEAVPIGGTPLPDEAKNRPIPPVPQMSDEERAKLPTEGIDWFKYVEEQGPLANEEENPDEHKAFSYTLNHAHRVPVEILANHSIKNVILADLVKDGIRRSYRNELIHFEGRLVRVSIVPKPPRDVRDTIGIKQYYEGWLFPKDDPNFSPICILFTELPKGIEPKPNCNHWVKFDGYYFKLMEYPSNEKGPKGGMIWRVAPLLIGHSPQVIPEPTNPVTLSFEGTFLPIMVGIIVLLAGGAIALNYWFRKGDRAIRHHLDGSTLANPFENPPGMNEPTTDHPSNR